MLTSMNVAFANISGGLIFAGTHYGELNFSRVDLKRYCNELRTFDSDILGLSEVHLEDKDGTSAMLEEISNELGLPYYQAQYMHDSHLDTSKQMGTAILSKYPIIASESFVLESPKLEIDRPNGDHWVMFDKSAQRVTVETDEGLLDIVNLSYFPFHHFGRRMDETAFSALRAKLVSVLLADGNPTIILGDFNNKFVPFDSAFPELLALGFAEAHKAATTVVGYDTEQLDHILYPTQCFLAADGKTREIGSDHLAIAARLDRLRS